MTRQEYIFSVRSFAGKISSSRRWSNHVKRPTKTIRIYEDDYNRLVDIVDRVSSVDSISFAVTYAVDRLYMVDGLDRKKS